MKLLGRMSAGLIFWAFGFALLYGLHGIGCARGWHTVAAGGGTLFGWIMISAWIILMGGALAIVGSSLRTASGWAGRLAVALALGGLAGILLTGAPVALTTACM